MPDFRHHKRYYLVEPRRYGTCFRVLRTFAPFDNVATVDNTYFPCFSSAAGNRLASLTICVSSPFSFLAALVTFVACFCLSCFLRLSTAHAVLHLVVDEHLPVHRTDQV